MDAHRWPGNVRELSNAVQRFAVTPERVLPTEGVPEVSAPIDDAAPISPLRIARRDASDAFERAHLAKVLGRTSGNLSRAAAVAEVSRQMMHKLVRKHGAE